MDFEPKPRKGRQFSRSMSLLSYEDYAKKYGRRATLATYHAYVTRFKEDVLGEYKRHEIDPCQVRPTRCQ